MLALASFVCGLLFGVGLFVSGMTSRQRFWVSWTCSEYGIRPWHL